MESGKGWVVHQIKVPVEVSIADEGGGIEEAYINKVFEPFFTTKSQGSGLGLYICYQVVRRHQGDITVANTAGGTRFTVTLPVVPGSARVVGGGTRKVHG